MEENGKRLTKGNDKLHCGVCSGVAEYFGWDVTIVRVATVIVSCLYGIGVIAYIASALIFPNPES